MAFWKSHTNPVSWWLCRHWPIRINKWGHVVRAEGAGIRVWAVLSAVRQLGSVDPERGWSLCWGPELQEMHQCPIHCLVLETSFLESSGFGCLINLCCPTCVKSSVAQLKKYSLSWEAANMVFLFVYYAYYDSQIQRLGSCFWRRPNGLLCIWMSSMPSFSLLLPLGPWFW